MSDESVRKGGRPEGPDEAAERAARAYSRRLGRRADPAAVEQYRRAALALALVDRVTGSVVDEVGVPIVLRAWYLAFGRQVWARLARNRPELRAELAGVQLAWVARGLAPELLAAVERQLRMLSGR